jgi:hypothetical protein
MHNIFKQKSHNLACIALFFGKTCFCQLATDKKIDVVSPSLQRTEVKLKKGSLGFEIKASMLPKAKITRESGSYQLQSYLQSSYSLGADYLFAVKKNLLISSGLHLVIGKRNYFANIPSQDINDWDGRKIIEEKELWSHVQIPLSVEKRIFHKKNYKYAIKGGLRISYSGFRRDESVDHYLVYSNGQTVHIFNAELSARNNGKPWLIFFAGFSKLIELTNKNTLAVSFIADISPCYFFSGNYSITIPNKPITTGEYKISGSCLGISLQYIFTGTNHKLIKTI